MIFQQFNLVPRLDVLTNVLAGRLNHVPTARALFMLFTARERALAIRALDRLDIADLALNRADALSGGQQQRVAIARALMQEPRLLLADEPIASLDPMNAKLVMDALRDINRHDGITVLCNLHTLDTARAYCDRIVGMAQGRIVFDGAPETLDEAAVRSIYGAADHEHMRGREDHLDEPGRRGVAGVRARLTSNRGEQQHASQSLPGSHCRVCVRSGGPRTPIPKRPKEFRVGLLGGENTQDRLARYGKFQQLLEQKLGIPVKLFPAADYAGVMQGIAAGQLEMAGFGASGFAGAWLDCKCVEPIVVPQENDGSTYYYSVMVVRADSGIKTMEDMKGHSLAWADPNSTSGYLIPSATLKAKGIKLDDGAYFSKTGFSGGHEQGVVAVLNKQYDGAVTWTSGQGEKSEGYTRGNLRSMVDKKMLKMSDVNIIWQSGKIPNGPWAVRIALPAELKKTVTEFMLDLPKSHKDVYDDVERGSGVGYAPATMELYHDIIELRQAEQRANRS